MLSKRGRWQKPLKTNFEQFMANLIGLNGLKKKLPLTQNLNKSDTYKKCFERESIERICNWTAKAVFVAQLAEWLLLIPEVISLNPVIRKFL